MFSQLPGEGFYVVFSGIKILHIYSALTVSGVFSVQIEESLTKV